MEVAAAVAGLEQVSQQRDGFGDDGDAFAGRVFFVERRAVVRQVFFGGLLERSVEVFGLLELYLFDDSRQVLALFAQAFSRFEISFMFLQIRRVALLLVGRLVARGFLFVEESERLLVTRLVPEEQVDQSLSESGPTLFFCL